MCHIQRSWKAKTYKTIVGFLHPRVYCPFQALGQFFHSYCIQSMLSIIPENPRISLIWSSRIRSSRVGLLRYSSPNKYMIPLKFSKHNIEVLSPIRRHSSTALAAKPYAIIRIAVIAFCNAEKPNLSVASLLCSKYGIGESINNTHEQQLVHSKRVEIYMEKMSDHLLSNRSITGCVLGHDLFQYMLFFFCGFAW